MESAVSQVLTAAVHAARNETDAALDALEKARLHGYRDRAAIEATSEGMHVSGTPYHNQYHFLLESDGDKIDLHEERFPGEADPLGSIS